MGGLLAFRVDNYTNTAEREQFRFLCEQLKVHYEKSNDICLFVGNYNIGCELDALFVKNDAVIVVEFKNYGGNVVAMENGEWKCDNQIIKGGSRKTVLQQARVNRVTVRRELKYLGVSSKNIVHIPCLVVFNQKIELQNNLSATTKSWLHITDNEHFIQKLDDITSSKTDFDKDGIIHLSKLLNLSPFYLEEFSNVRYDSFTLFPDNDVISEHRTNSEEKVSIESTEVSLNNEEKKAVPACSDVISGHFPTSNDKVGTNGISTLSKEEKGPNERISEEVQSLRSFVKQILRSVLKINDFKIAVYYDSSAQHEVIPEGLILNKKFLVTVDSKGISEYCLKLRGLINRDVKVLNQDIVYWQDGPDVTMQGKNIDGKSYLDEGHQALYRIKNNDNGYKFKTTLPHWLDLELYNSIKAIYDQNHKGFEYKHKLNTQELKVDLGTYFPRSYAESFCIFNDLFKIPKYKERLEALQELNIFDFGCGTGGEIVGLLVVLAKYLKIPRSINIVALDRRINAIKCFEEICNVYSLNVHHKINLLCVNKEIKSDKDLLFLDLKSKYHFVLNCKVVNELLFNTVLTADAYFKVVKAFAPFLDDEGILFMSDITCKETNSIPSYPELMNNGIGEFLEKNKEFVVLPIAIDGLKDSITSFSIEQVFTVSHTQRSYDESRVCYQIICRKRFKDLL